MNHLLAFALKTQTNVTRKVSKKNVSRHVTSVQHHPHQHPHQAVVPLTNMLVMELVMMSITMQNVTMMKEIAAHLIHLQQAGMTFVRLVNVSKCLQLKNHVRTKDLPPTEEPCKDE